MLRNFVLAKVTKTVSAEMLLSAAGLCPQTGKNLGLQVFFGGCFFSMALKIAAQFRRATLSLQYPVCENFSGVVCFQWPSRLLRSFAGLPYRFNTPNAKIFRGIVFFQWPSRGGLLCPSPLHRIAGFPRFFSEALLRTEEDQCIRMCAYRWM